MTDPTKIKLHPVPYILDKQAAVLIDGQYGSTGKGLLAAFLASQPHNAVDFAVTNASANAGHWTKFADSRNGSDFCCYHLPTFGVIQPCSKIILNAGSIINPDLLLAEMETCKVSMDRVCIHPNATVITKEDILREENLKSQATKISSTQKGVGAALARKITRTAEIARNNETLAPMIDNIDLNSAMSLGARVSIEMPQGYSLSLNGKFYPYCTSRDCTVSAALSSAGIHPSYLGRVVMSVRTYPIRVGNIPKYGYSGDTYADQEEITFESLGVPNELTTVTKRIRRIFTWSDAQYTDALIENRPDITFLNFCNYASRDTILDIWEHIQKVSLSRLGYMQHRILGWGPNVEDVAPLLSSYSTMKEELES